MAYARKRLVRRLKSKHYRMTPPSHRLQVLVVIIVLGCIVAVSLGWPAIVRRLNSWQLVPEPERLTELYFSQGQKLPTTYRPGEEQSVGVTVHNDEGMRIRYVVSIAAVGGDGDVQAVVYRHSFTLRSGGYVTRRAVFGMPDVSSRERLEVLLTFAAKVVGSGAIVRHEEEIYYWVREAKG